MKAFAISLPTATQRRSELSQSLPTAGIDFEFFDAVTPADNPQQHFEPLDHGIFYAETQRREMEPTEYACFASHLMLWRTSVERNEPMVILEDDVRPAATCRRDFAQLDEAVAKYGFVRLEPREEAWNYLRGEAMPEPLEAERFGALSIQHPTFMYLRTSAYALGPEAAAKLLAASRSASCPADTFFRRTWVHRQPMFVADPPLFELTEAAQASDIGGRERDAATAGTWLERQLARRRKHWAWFWARFHSRREAARVRKAFRLGAA